MMLLFLLKLFPLHSVDNQCAVTNKRVFVIKVNSRSFVMLVIMKKECTVLAYAFSKCSSYTGKQTSC